MEEFKYLTIGHASYDITFRVDKYPIENTKQRVGKHIDCGGGPASNAGYSIPLLSGFRSHQKQIELYNRYVARDGKDAADTYSARPGHSEHETGLTFDIGAVDDNYGETAPGKWLANHAHEYGFIIRYPEGKEDITKYQYEPWHVRYVGKEHAKKIYENQLTLEEYLGIA